MAKKVIWSFRSQNDRKQIFEYWNDRNSSNHYSIKLNKLFIDAVNSIEKFPRIGKKTSDDNVRINAVII
ncbi:MAG: hypothetical protein ABI851_11275 [Saprospiraceae bacterium]